MQESSSELLARIMVESGQPDSFFVRLFGVNQSTVWRLRHKQIQKVNRYLAVCQRLGITRDNQRGIDLIETMMALGRAAEDSPELRLLLDALHKFVHKSEQ